MKNDKNLSLAGIKANLEYYKNKGANLLDELDEADSELWFWWSEYRSQKAKKEKQNES